MWYALGVVHVKGWFKRSRWQELFLYIFEPLPFGLSAQRNIQFIETQCSEA